jgi:endonuclease YncB( thermonuclease family)
MLPKIILLISTFFFSSFIYSQSYRITKVLETNLFELDNNKKVKLYGLYIPSRHDTNIVLSKLARTIFQWENVNLLDENISVEILGKSDEGIDLVAMYENYPLFIKENIADEFLSNGWASIMHGINNDYLQKIIKYQEDAQNNKNGIWKEDISVIKNIDTPLLNTKEMAVFTSRPYIPLLGLSIASFALAWDYFSSASDLQKTIDGATMYTNVSDLKKTQTRKYIVGATCLLAGVVTFIFSFETVEVRTNFQSLSLSYKL